jgi:hypothetical protein
MLHSNPINYLASKELSHQKTLLSSETQPKIISLNKIKPKHARRISVIINKTIDTSTIIGLVEYVSTRDYRYSKFAMKCSCGRYYFLNLKTIVRHLFGVKKTNLKCEFCKL